MEQGGAESKEYADGWEGLGGVEWAGQPCFLPDTGRSSLPRPLAWASWASLPSSSSAMQMLALEGWYESLGRQRGERESAAKVTGGSGIGTLGPSMGDGKRQNPFI